MPENPAPEKGTAPGTRPRPALETLLRRGDVWRGHSRAFVPRHTQATGYPQLDNVLQGEGWPLGGLIEIAAPGHRHRLSPGANWLLMAPALLSLLREHQGYLFLLNPPVTPFAQGLIQQHIVTDRLLVANTGNKQDFIAAFTELSQADYCLALVGWQPAQPLNYTELRKCQLACDQGQSLNLLFRPEGALQQSSPAPLRLRMTLDETCLHLQVVKQKGRFNNAGVSLPLPTEFLPQPPYRYLQPHPLPAATEFRQAANHMFGTLSGSPLAPDNLVPLPGYSPRLKR